MEERLLLVLAMMYWWCVGVRSQLSSCTFESGRGRIDLTALGNPDGVKASFHIQFNGHDYLYNPCYGLQYGDESCSQNTAVCQHDSNGGSPRSCGALTSERIIEEGNQISIQYTGGNGGRETTVNLVCDQSANKPSFTGISDESIFYVFQLKSKCVCPGATCHLNSSGNKTGAIGITFMFLFVACVVAYFVIGTLVLKFKFQKSGLEMIPQRAFWFALPFLIKDGFVYTFNPLIKLARKDKTDNLMAE